MELPKSRTGVPKNSYSKVWSSILLKKMVFNIAKDFAGDVLSNLRDPVANFTLQGF